MQNYHYVKILKPRLDADNLYSPARTKRSVAYSEKFWKNASTVSFSFMRALPEEMKYRVERCIRQWEPFVSLAFERVEDGPGQIRIDLEGSGNYSALGTNALTIASDEPTLVVTERSDTPSFEISLIHEFGHALGFHHAHLHPDANIPWDKDAVYQYFVEVVGWEKDEVDLNLFDLDTTGGLVLGNYDKHSIMHYPIQSFLTTDNFEIPINKHISEGDKQLARIAYPPINYQDVSI